MTAQIEEAAKVSGIAGSEHRAAIDPEPASRLGDSSYLEKPTLIQLREAKLPQVIALLSRLTGFESAASTRYGQSEARRPPPL